MKTLGLSISSRAVRAVLSAGEAIAWAGTASYDGLDDLADVIARLAAEAGRPTRRTCVVLERDVVQLRTVVPAPPIRATAVKRYVALEAPRLFRKDGAPLVTDGRLVPSGGGPALRAAAVPEPLLRAVLEGCLEAGLSVAAIGPAADVLPRALAPSATTSEFALPVEDATELLDLGPDGTLRSRLRRGVPDRGPTLTAALTALGPQAALYAAAFAAARARPRLELWPADLQVARMRNARKRLLRLGALAATLWIAAGAVYAGRLALASTAARRALERAAATLDSMALIRRDLNGATATLATIARAERNRSPHIALLATLSAALGDSTYLVAVRVAADGSIRLVGYAPVAARARADLERASGFRDVRFEGPVTREGGDGRRALDRFAIVARWQAREEAP